MEGGGTPGLIYSIQMTCAHASLITECQEQERDLASLGARAMSFMRHKVIISSEGSIEYVVHRIRVRGIL
jgi:hypothetical protein